MKRLLTLLAALGVAALVLAVAPVAGTPGSSLWSASVTVTNVRASSPTTGAGYPVPAGSRVPEAGTCRPGPFDANHSESWLAVKPGTEDLVGSSKFFFDKFSTFYMIPPPLPLVGAVLQRFSAWMAGGWRVIEVCVT